MAIGVVSRPEAVVARRSRLHEGLAGREANWAAAVNDTEVEDMARRRSSSDDLIARSQEEIRARLAEIEPLVAEKDRLERALEALEGVTGSRSAPARIGRPAPTDGRRGARGRSTLGRASGRRTPRGARQRELLTLVRDAPGLTVSAAARTIGISSSQASNLARRLAEEGEIRRTDQGLVAVTEGEAELPAPG
jgi:hypothetical protein